MTNNINEPVVVPNIGVFLCKCGKNIDGTVDIDQLAEEIEKISSVKLVQVNTYTCSEPGQVEIETAIKEQGIERSEVSFPFQQEVKYKGRKV